MRGTLQSAVKTPCPTLAIGLEEIRESPSPKVQETDIQGHKWKRGGNQEKLMCSSNGRNLMSSYGNQWKLLRKMTLTSQLDIQETMVSTKKLFRNGAKDTYFSKTRKAKIAQNNTKKNKTRSPKFKFGQKVSRPLQEAYQIDE
jgi:hypothetical protein